MGSRTGNAGGRRLVSAGSGTRLRHIAPTSRFASEGATTTVLGRSYGFTELPLSRAPTGADLVEGAYTGRLGDAGEFTLTFPNAAGAKGLWRERFSADLALEFIEIYDDDVLEFVGSIQRIEIDRGSVTVSGTDAWSLLRRAYERDRTWTAAPQEVATAYTRVPVAVVADDFPGVALSGWTVAANTTVTVADGTATIRTTAGGGAPQISRSLGTLGDTWRATAVVRAAGTFAPGDDLLFGIQGSTNGAFLYIADGLWTFYDPTGSAANIGKAPAAARNLPLTLQIERRGRWLVGFVNGQLIGFFECPSGMTGTLSVALNSLVSGTGDLMVVDSVNVTEQRGFLARGSDVGDQVLPGDYPTGGLRGRYFNDADHQGLGTDVRALRILAPDRTSYGERLDPVINTGGGLALPLQPGAASTYFSVRWFGAIYLNAGAGASTPFDLGAVGGRARLWIGKTAFTAPLINNWFSTGGGTFTGTLTHSAVGAASGWYPLVLEYRIDTGAPAINLQYTPSSSYTDPGGTAITSGVKRTVPATSLSPLGCYDGRIQGQSHFDVVQAAATQFGYQLRCAPMSLESGEFPGRLVPRRRVGRDTDKVLEVDDTDRADPVLSPGVTIDASDQTLLLIGSGAGLSDGRGSQVTTEISDLANLDDALFALEGVVDAGDIGFVQLLEARMNAELALRGTPWEEVRGTPLAQKELADTWPLSATLSAMRWEPGDGLRLNVPDVGVVDDAPRQLLQVTRTFNALGRTGTSVAFRQRPRSAARSVRGLLRSAISRGRSYQGQKVTLLGDYVSSAPVAGAYTLYSYVPLLPGDHVVRAYVRVVLNNFAQALGMEINGTDRTSSVGGGWSTVPLEVDVTAYATQVSATDNRLYVRMRNNGGVTTAIEFQLLVEVLR
ncbi:hypothetical protein [Miltoncostaea oceani]|uniref:hypothetical protein n=1 Tax=Miltoncostaea oceani TaxID=2843216 RepID=UPI001C3CBFB0|nr:hypothetical protein [Miltoncostaea oceani]